MPSKYTYTCCTSNYYCVHFWWICLLFTAATGSQVSHSTLIFVCVQFCGISLIILYKIVIKIYLQIIIYSYTVYVLYI